MLNRVGKGVEEAEYERATYEDGHEENERGARLAKKDAGVTQLGPEIAPEPLDSATPIDDRRLMSQ
jgi:hypothetical protein